MALGSDTTDHNLVDLSGFPVVSPGDDSHTG
jgi:hypothetical protein